MNNQIQKVREKSEWKNKIHIRMHFEEFLNDLLLCARFMRVYYVYGVNLHIFIFI